MAQLLRLRGPDQIYGARGWSLFRLSHHRLVCPNNTASNELITQLIILTLIPAKATTNIQTTTASGIRSLARLPKRNPPLHPHRKRQPPNHQNLRPRPRLAQKHRQRHRLLRRPNPSHGSRNARPRPHLLDLAPRPRLGLQNPAPL